MTANLQISISHTAAGVVATAIAPHGLFAARRPVTGPAAPTTQAAVAALLASPKLAATLTAMLTPRTYGNVNA